MNVVPCLIRSGHRYTRGAVKQERAKTATGDETGQCTLPEYGKQEDVNKKRSRPNGSACLTRVATKGGKEWGTPHPAVQSYSKQPGTGGGDPDTATYAPSARPRDGGREGNPHPSARANHKGEVEQGGHLNQAVRNPSM